MEIKIKSIFNMMPLCVRYLKDNENYEAMVFFNVEEGKLFHNIEMSSELRSIFDRKIIEMFGPLKPNVENFPQFEDYVTQDLQIKIDSARRGDTMAFDDRIDVMQKFTNKE